MLTISTNCSPLRPSFGNKTVLKQTAETAELLKSDADDETKAEAIQALSTALTQNNKQASPFKTFLTTVTVAVVGFFLGRKLAGKEVLSVVDKNTKLMDKAAKSLDKTITNIKKMPAIQDKTFAGFASRTKHKFADGLTKFSKKGLSAEEAAKADVVNKNGVRKIVSNGTGGAIGSVGFISTITDNDGNKVPDYQQGEGAVGEAIKRIDGIVSIASVFVGG